MSNNKGQLQTIQEINAYNGTLPLIFPIAGDSYRLKDNWHIKRGPKRCSADHSFNEEKRAHNGVDIGSKLGTLLYSCVDGIIIPPPYDDFPIERYGNSVWVQSDAQDTSFGYSFLYAHLDHVYVEVGQKVNTGTKIGTMGMTGNSLRPHLHFEIHYPPASKYGCIKCKPAACHITAINPYPSLSKAKLRPKSEEDLTVEKQNAAMVMIGNLARRVFDKPSILWRRD